MAVIQSTLRSQIEETGYVVVPRAVPQENIDAVIADIWRHTGADPHDRETWYLPDLIGPTGMVAMYHDQSMWNNRQHPHVYEIFKEILGTEKLWVWLDRVNLKPPIDPQHPAYDHKGFIHLDTDISPYPNVPFGVQGVLALTDTDADMGGFQCVPELYRDLGTWLARQPQGADLRNPDLAGYSITKVPLRAGDMVIWSSLLPHGNGRNVSDRPRLAQYITMTVAREDKEEARQARIKSWEGRLPPPFPWFERDPRGVEESIGHPPELTPLGRKLLGLDSWT